MRYEKKVILCLFTFVFILLFYLYLFPTTIIPKKDYNTFTELLNDRFYRLFLPKFVSTTAVILSKMFVFLIFSKANECFSEDKITFLNQFNKMYFWIKWIFNGLILASFMTILAMLLN